MKKYIFIIIALILIYAVRCDAAVFYVRDDGGTGAQCDGLTDAAVAGSPNCAFNHPNWVLPASNDWDYTAQDYTYRHASGDTVVIHGPDDGAGTGIYRMGCQNATDCVDASKNYIKTTGTSTGKMGYIILVDGTVGNHTTVVGCSLTGCGSSAKPQLWLAGRMSTLFEIGGSAYLTFKDLEITDHHGADNECSEGKTAGGLCGRKGFGGEGVTHDINMIGLDIHGLTSRGILIGGDAEAGSLTTNVNLLIQDTNIDGNDWAGIDTDTCSGDLGWLEKGACGFTGDITLQRVNIRWNGCSEAYPVVWGPGLTGRLPTPGSCRMDTNTGYGDGIGLASTGGNWVFEDGIIAHNTSDGGDWLYCGQNDRYAYGDCNVTIKRSLFEGNNGNQIKAPNPYLEDNIIIGNCEYFKVEPNGYTASGFSECRAFGAPIAIRHLTEKVTKIYNNTIISNGDVMFSYGGEEYEDIRVPPEPNWGQCNLDIQNNILIGGWQYNQDRTAMFYYEPGIDCTVANVITENYNICYGEFKSSTCTNTNDQDDTDPIFTGTLYLGTADYSPNGFYTGTEYYLEIPLQVTSPSIGAADQTISGTDSLDYNSYPRADAWEIGALEYGSVPTGGAAPICGDLIIDAGEDCDGTNLNGESCVNQGYDLGGTLSCSSCSFNFTGCASSLCGNGVVESLEECDDGGTVNGDGCDAFCYWEDDHGLGMSLGGCSIVGGGIN